MAIGARVRKEVSRNVYGQQGGKGIWREQDPGRDRGSGPGAEPDSTLVKYGPIWLEATDDG